MELVDSRRLTGPSVLWDRPGAVIDVLFEDADPNLVVETWRTQLRRMLDALGWSGEQTSEHRYADGASLALSAPRDALYAATEVNDWAWEATVAVVDGKGEPVLDEARDRLRAIIDEERNSRLVELHTACRARGLPCLSDDDHLSIGLGKMSQTWPVDRLPIDQEVEWESLGAVPVGLVTGTNGKTTSVRLAAEMARAAGLTPGISSTDWIAVGADILERGDYSGPGGARTVLRDRRVEIAILETARGGLQRRGLALEHADAALITNVAADHLGDFGLPDVEALADVKWVVTRALRAGDPLVLNADDPALVERGRAGAHTMTWFSPDAGNPVLQAHSARGGRTVTILDDILSLCSGTERRAVIALADIPLALGGAAMHNVANALGAAGLADALGLPVAAIASGLRDTRPADNRGRGNLLEFGGARAVVDFAHNPHGAAAIFDMARRLEARRRLVVIGQAGDRSDEAIRELTRLAWDATPDRIVVKEMPRYARGRAPGEVSGIIGEELARLGAPPEMVSFQPSEMDAVREAADWAREGDLLILLIHEDPDAVVDFLSSR